MIIFLFRPYSKSFCTTTLHRPAMRHLYHVSMRFNWRRLLIQNDFFISSMECWTSIEFAHGPPMHESKTNAAFRFRNDCEIRKKRERVWVYTRSVASSPRRWWCEKLCGREANEFRFLCVYRIYRIISFDSNENNTQTQARDMCERCMYISRPMRLKNMHGTDDYDSHTVHTVHTMRERMHHSIHSVRAYRHTRTLCRRFIKRFRSSKCVSNIYTKHIQVKIVHVWDNSA